MGVWPLNRISLPEIVVCVLASDGLRFAWASQALRKANAGCCGGWSITVDGVDLTAPGVTSPHVCVPADVNTCW